MVGTISLAHCTHTNIYTYCTHSLYTHTHTYRDKHNRHTHIHT